MTSVTSTAEGSKQRNSSLDVLKVIMAIMVVGIHCELAYDYSYVIGEVLVDGVFRIAVPVFFIINGYFFYREYKHGGVFRWMVKIAILYVVWMLIYSYYWFDSVYFSIDGFGRLVNQWLTGFAHLWYVAAMIPSAIMLICLYRLRLSLAILVSFIVMFYSVGVFVQYAGNLHFFDGDMDILMNKTWYHRNALFVGFPFMFMGFLINKYNLADKLSRQHLMSAFVISLVMVFIELVFNIYKVGPDQGLDNMVSVFILSPVVFLFFMRARLQANSRYLSNFSSALFFVHFFAIFLIDSVIDLSSVVKFIYVMVISFLFSIVVIGINKKVKFLL